MSSFTIPVRTVFTLTWTLTNPDGTPINNAAMTATLYAGRSLRNPEGVPGTPVPPINNLAMNYVLGTDGQYAALVPGTVDPPLDGTGYVLVIDATIGSNQIYHNEQPATVETAGSVMDLTTVDIFKGWNPGTTTSDADDSLIQGCITAWGFEFLRRTGLGDQGGDFTQSPFNSVCNWDETYDGSGTQTLMLRNRPIKSVTSLLVNGVQIASSPGYPTQGFVINGSKKAISLRGGILGFGNQLWSSWQSGPYHAFAGGKGFPRGIQNISVQYSAGYNDTPADIVQAANMIIALNYRRRAWVGERQRAVAGGGGTITFTDWDVPPEVQTIIDLYTRTL